MLTQKQHTHMGLIHDGLVLWVFEVQ